MRTALINPCLEPHWDNRVAMFPGATCFHTTGWTRVLMDTYGYQPIYAVLENSTGPVALIPLLQINSPVGGRRAVGLPFTDHCEPLVVGSTAFDLLWQWLLEQGAQFGWRYLELRGGQGHLGDQVPFQRFIGHQLDLSPTATQLHRQLKAAVRRNINRALKQGVSVQSASSLADLRCFYRLNCLTRKRHGLPPQPWRFFRSVHQHLLSRGHGRLWLARWSGRVIASAVFFHFGRHAIFKYGASDYDYQDKRGNDAVMWQAICWYREQGFKSLDFGRTGLDNAGLRRYKCGWGATERALCYYRYCWNRHRYRVGDSSETHGYNRFLRRLPIPLLRIIGELLYKQMG